MRKLIFQVMISVDGLFEGSDREIDWHLVDEDFNDYAIGLLREVDMLLFGRVTYELMAGYWPTPAAASDDPVVADFMNRLPKIVFSETMEKAEWNNTTLIKENAADTIRELKNQPGKDMAIFGGSDFAASILDDGLIDEYRIIVSPVFLGNGKKLFRGLNFRLPLQLIKAKVFDSGNVLLYYQPQK